MKKREQEQGEEEKDLFVSIGSLSQTEEVDTTSTINSTWK